MAQAHTLNKFLYLASAAIIPLVFADAAIAQAVEPATAAGNEQTGVPADPQAADTASQADPASVFNQDEIVITATRREERLNTVPVSVTAISGGQLEALGAEDITDIKAITPNFAVTSVALRPNDPVLAIRGILKRDADATVDTAVGVYSDEVFLARGYSVMGQLLDVQRVEVLRGPQGTLFGRNTIGGAVQVISRAPDPGGPMDGYVEGSIGNYNLMRVAGASNLSLSDAIAIRVAGKFTKHDGYTKSYLVNDTGPNGYRLGDPIIDVIDTNDAKDWSFRVGLAIEPTADTRIDLSAYRSASDTNGVLSRGLMGDLGVLTPTFFNSTAPCAPGGCGIAGGYSAVADGDFYKALTDIRPNADSDVGIYIGKIQHDFGPVAAKFIASFAKASSESALNLDGVVGFGTPLVVRGPGIPPPLAGREIQSFSEAETKQTTFELQFSGDIGDRIDWITGAYYFTETSDDLVYTARSDIGPTGVPFSVADVRAKNDSKSIYGSVGFDITETLKLRAGGRYTEDTKRFLGKSRTYNPATGIGTCAFNPAITFPTGLEMDSFVDPLCKLKNSQDFSNFTWDVSLDFKITPDVFVYGKVGTGYRTGGISLNANSPLTAVPFDEDRVTSFEAGVKADIARWAHINATAFYTKYKDVQQNVSSAEIVALGIPCAQGYVGPPVVLSCNIGNAHTKGIEVDARVDVTKRFTLFGTYGYTDFEYKNPAYIALFVPKHTASLSASYEAEIGRIPIEAILQWQYSSSYYGGLTNNGVPRNFAKVDGSSLLNARLNFDVRDDLTVSLWARNITKDEYYASSITLTAPVIQTNAGLPGTPRTFGVDAKFSF